MSRRFEFDAIVVGAGPAGAASATLLAEDGLRVLRTDYDPVCGRRPYRPYGLGVRRIVLDRILFERAASEPGVEIATPLRVVGLLRGAGGAVEGIRGVRPGGREIEIRAPLLVGADGTRSRVACAARARWPGRRPPRPGPAGLRDYVERREEEFGPRVRACRGVQRLLRHRSLPRFVLGRLRARPDLAERLVAVSGDYVPPEAVIGPRFLARLCNPFERAGAEADAREPRRLR